MNDTRHIIKFDFDMYVEWSTVTETPTSRLMSGHEMLQYLCGMYGSTNPVQAISDRRDFTEMINRADMHGSSDPSITSWTPARNLIANNRAGRHGSTLGYHTLLEKLYNEAQEFTTGQLQT